MAVQSLLSLPTTTAPAHVTYDCYTRLPCNPQRIADTAAVPPVMFIRAISLGRPVMLAQICVADQYDHRWTVRLYDTAFLELRCFLHLSLLIICFSSQIQFHRLSPVAVCDP